MRLIFLCRKVLSSSALNLRNLISWFQSTLTLTLNRTWSHFRFIFVFGLILTLRPILTFHNFFTFLEHDICSKFYISTTFENFFKTKLEYSLFLFQIISSNKFNVFSLNSSSNSKSNIN